MKMREDVFERIEPHMIRTDDRITVYPYQRQRKLIDQAHQVEVERRLDIGLSPISRSKWILDVLMEGIAGNA